MARALSPAFLRIGGTAADLLRFQEKSFFEPLSNESATIASGSDSCYCTSDRREDAHSCEKKVRRNFTMTGHDWMQINEFAIKSNLKILFDLNVLRRDSRGQWSTSNAKKLLKFSSKLGFNSIAWELGNEPNSFHHVFNVTLSGTQLGRDFKRLHHLLASFPDFANSTLVGPDINQIRRCVGKKHVCKPLRYLKNVMQSSKGVLDALTWHQYYLNGRTARLKDFLSAKVLDSFQEETDAVKKFLGKSHVPIWLGETSSAYGGGAKGLSDRYVAGFLWLDKLGLAALNKYSVIIRQTFYHGCYALIGPDLLPNPDFWISALYKKLVGNRVLKVTKDFITEANLRLYSHCAKNGAGSVVLFGLNLANKTASFHLPPELSRSRIEHYVVSPLNGDLRSRSLLLNGKLLGLINSQLPPLLPRVTSKMPQLALKAWQMAYWVFPDVKAKACQTSTFP